MPSSSQSRASRSVSWMTRWSSSGVIAAGKRKLLNFMRSPVLVVQLVGGGAQESRLPLKYVVLHRGRGAGPVARGYRLDNGVMLAVGSIHRLARGETAQAKQAQL